MSYSSGVAYVQESLIDAAGDLIVGTAANTGARLAAGTALTTQLVNTGSALAWQPTIVNCTAAVTVNNSTTLVDATGLGFSIAANEVWFVQAYLLVQGVSITADWKFGWTYPASATADWGFLAPGAAAQPGYGTPGVAGTATAMLAITDTLSVGGLNARQGIGLGGVFSAAATAGTIQLQFAQNTATVENSILKKFDSFLLVRRLR